MTLTNATKKLFSSPARRRLSEQKQAIRTRAADLPSPARKTASLPAFQDLGLDDIPSPRCNFRKSRSLVKCDDLKPCDTLLFQFRILVNIFPSFPLEMLKVLVIQQTGRAKDVYDVLVEKGWKPSVPIESQLTNVVDPHLTEQFFWGEFQQSNLEELKGQKVGTFFVSMILPREYLICYVRSDNRVMKVTTNYPSVGKYQKIDLQLSQGLVRPKNICSQRLIAFLK